MRFHTVLRRTPSARSAPYSHIARIGQNGSPEAEMDRRAVNQKKYIAALIFLLRSTESL
jgi:hypothetical protein